MGFTWSGDTIPGQVGEYPGGSGSREFADGTDTSGLAGKLFGGWGWFFGRFPKILQEPHHLEAGRTRQTEAPSRSNNPTAPRLSGAKSCASVTD